MVFQVALLIGGVIDTRQFEEVLGMKNPATQHNNPGDLNPHQITNQAQKLTVTGTTYAAAASFL